VEANDAGANDMTITPATPVATEDAYLIGYRYQFSGLTITYSTATTDTGAVMTYQYYNGSAWASLGGVTDGTNSFITAACTADITWTMPGNWAQNMISGMTLFWVRAYLGTSPSVNQAKGDQAWIHPDPTVVDAKDQIKIEVRDQNEQVRRPLIDALQYRQVSEFTDRDKVARLTIAEPVIARPGDWVVISVKATAPVDVSGCYFDLTCDREMIHLF